MAIGNATNSQRQPAGAVGVEVARIRPPCAIDGCQDTDSCDHHFLTHGVRIWLCSQHRRKAFLTKRDGREFAERLLVAWLSVGALTSRRAAALRTHLRTLQGARPRGPRPGSYSWPRLRREAERRFARGQNPTRVIRDLRERHQADDAIVPSVRTMQRWFAQRRWLERPRHRPDPRQPMTRRESMAETWTELTPYLEILMTRRNWLSLLDVRLKR